MNIASFTEPYEQNISNGCRLCSLWGMKRSFVHRLDQTVDRLPPENVRWRNGIMGVPGLFHFPLDTCFVLHSNRGWSELWQVEDEEAQWIALRVQQKRNGM